IGRPRLSVTRAANPGRIAPLPDAVARILAGAPSRTDAQKADLARFVLTRALEEELAALPPPRLVFAAAPDFQPEGSFRPARGGRGVQVWRRGDTHPRGAGGGPGGLSCMGGRPAGFVLRTPSEEGERRAPRARWLTDPRNVLPGRVIVNRLWQHHLGRGIV